MDLLPFYWPTWISAREFALSCEPARKIPDKTYWILAKIYCSLRKLVEFYRKIQILVRFCSRIQRFFQLILNLTKQFRNSQTSALPFKRQKTKTEIQIPILLYKIQRLRSWLRSKQIHIWNRISKTIFVLASRTFGRRLLYRRD